MENREQFKNYLKESPNEITIIKFSATWCKPCQIIAPTVKMINDECIKKGKIYNFLDLDIDHCVDIYAFMKQKKMVRGIPVLLCYKKSEYTDNNFYAPSDSVTGSFIPDIVSFYKRNLY